jgi:hypothetical protein
MSAGQDKDCRHEFVKIFQRKLKGLERRMVVTRAYLPIGFKPGDLNHLGEGSFCFCAKCRLRLYPRRTQAEKAAARLALAAGKVKEEVEMLEESHADPPVEKELVADIDVEELEQEPVDVQDIEADGVKLADDDSSCQLASDE